MNPLPDGMSKEDFRKLDSRGRASIDQVIAGCREGNPLYVLAAREMIVSIAYNMPSNVLVEVLTVIDEELMKETEKLGWLK